MGVRKKGRRQSDPSREEAESTDEENIQEVGFHFYICAATLQPS